MNDVQKKLNNFEKKVKQNKLLKISYKQDIIDALRNYRKTLNETEETRKEEVIKKINSAVNLMKKRLRIYNKWNSINRENIEHFIGHRENAKSLIESSKYANIIKKSKEYFTEPNQNNIYSGKILENANFALKLLNIIRAEKSLLENRLTRIHKEWNNNQIRHFKKYIINKSQFNNILKIKNIKGYFTRQNDPKSGKFSKHAELATNLLNRTQKIKFLRELSMPDERKKSFKEINNFAAKKRQPSNNKSKQGHTYIS